MEAEELSSLLRELFPGCEVGELERMPESRRLSGLLAWSGFDGLSHIERQKLVLAKLHSRLSPGEVRKVGLMWTFTPEEAVAYAED